MCVVAVEAAVVALSFLGGDDKGVVEASTGSHSSIENRNFFGVKSVVSSLPTLVAAPSEDGDVGGGVLFIATEMITTL